MPENPTTIADPWNRVIENWRRSNIVIRSGVSSDAIAAFQSTYRVVLSADVREYFMASDGTGYEMDNDMYRFWPLAEVKPVHEELADNKHISYPVRFAYPDCFVFADHCISCWDYALKLTDDPTQRSPVFRVKASYPPGEKMASSFREFMTQYADDPNNII